MASLWRELTTSFGLLILRIGIGAYMAAHGWGKVKMFLDGNTEMFSDPIGIGKTLSLFLAMFAEFFCSILVMLGFLTRLAAVPVVIAMGVAAFVVHADDPWTMGPGASKEPALLFLIPFLTLIFTGAGRFSVDGLIVPVWRSWRARRTAQAAR